MVLLGIGYASPSSPAEPSPSQPCRDMPCGSSLSSGRLGSARPGLARPGLARPSSARLGPAWLGQAWLGLARPGSAWSVFVHVGLSVDADERRRSGFCRRRAVLRRVAACLPAARDCMCVCVPCRPVASWPASLPRDPPDTLLRAACDSGPGCGTAAASRKACLLPDCCAALLLLIVAAPSAAGAADQPLLMLLMLLMTLITCRRLPLRSQCLSPVHRVVSVS